MPRVEGKMSRVENKISRSRVKFEGPKICVEVSFPAFFELIERPRCQRVQAFPLFSAFRTFSLFICACDSEFIILVVEGLLRAFSFLSFFF